MAVAIALIAAGVMACSLMLLHARGFAGIWRTGPHAENKPARRMLGAKNTERLLGWLYVRTAERSETPRAPRPPDVSARILNFGPDGCPICRKPVPPDDEWILRSRHRTSEGVIGYSTRSCGCMAIAINDRVVASFEGPAGKSPRSQPSRLRSTARYRRLSTFSSGGRGRGLIYGRERWHQ